MRGEALGDIADKPTDFLLIVIIFQKLLTFLLISEHFYGIIDKISLFVLSEECIMTKRMTEQELAARSDEALASGHIYVKSQPKNGKPLREYGSATLAVDG